MSPLVWQWCNDHLNRLRVGTFNVNGKPPLEDLAAWTRGPESFASKLPPLQNLSPLSIGLSERPPSDLRRASSSNASSLDRDPDIFVFGFQELDLSTEALLYSTSTIKEDSWTAAIFASLGSKASQYTKVTILLAAYVTSFEWTLRALLACFKAISWHVNYYHCQSGSEAPFLGCSAIGDGSRHHGCNGSHTSSLSSFKVKLNRAIDIGQQRRHRRSPCVHSAGTRQGIVWV